MKKSSFKFLAIVIALAILGMLLIPAATASILFIEEFDVDDLDEVISRKMTTDGLKVTTLKYREIEIDFTTRIKCGNALHILLIEEEGNVRYVSEKFFESTDLNDEDEGGGCEIDDTIATPSTKEDKVYTIVFLSLEEERIILEDEDWQFEIKSTKQIIDEIEENTVGVAGSNDAIATRIVNVKIQSVSESEELIKIKNEDLVWSNNELRIYGTSNLIENDDFRWTLLDSNRNDIVSNSEEVGENGIIKFRINTKGIDYGKYWLKIDTDRHSKEFSINLEPESTPALEPTIEKSSDVSVSSSYSPEILESTPTPTWPPPTAIPGLPEPETPGMNWLSIFLAIAATVIFLKKKKHFRDH